MAWVTLIGVSALHASPKQEPVQHAKPYGVWVARMGMISIFSLLLLNGAPPIDVQAENPVAECVPYVFIIQVPTFYQHSHGLEKIQNGIQLVGVLLILQPFFCQSAPIRDHRLLRELLLQGEEMLYLRFPVRFFELRVGYQ